MSDVDVLYAYARSKPEGFTSEQACLDLRWSLSKFQYIKHNLLLGLSERGETLICNPEGWGVMKYRLTSDELQILYWLAPRLQDADSRSLSILGVINSLVHATKPDTIIGKEARMLRRQMQRLKEDIEVMLFDEEVYSSSS